MHHDVKLDDGDISIADAKTEVVSSVNAEIVKSRVGNPNMWHPAISGVARQWNINKPLTSRAMFASGRFVACAGSEDVNKGYIYYRIKSNLYIIVLIIIIYG